MGWTSYYVGGAVNRKEECLKITETEFLGKTVKTVMKGTTCFALKEFENKHYILGLLTSIRGNEFYYKDIGINPYEQGFIVPLSILKEFKPSTEEDSKWLETQLKKSKELKSKTIKYDIGDILECKANNDISWSTGHELKKGEKFFVTVRRLNPFKSKTKKIFVITEYEKDFKGEYSYIQRPRRLSSRYFTILRKIH